MIMILISISADVVPQLRDISDLDDNHVSDDNHDNTDYGNDDLENHHDNYDPDLDNDDLDQCRRRAAEQLTFQSGTIYAQQYQGGRYDYHFDHHHNNHNHFYQNDHSKHWKPLPCFIIPAFMIISMGFVW